MYLSQYLRHRLLLDQYSSRINSLTIHRKLHVDYQLSRHLKLKYYSNLFELMHLYQYKLHSTRNMK